MTIEILHRDEQICIVNKSPDLLVHRSKMGRDDETVIDLLKEAFPSPPAPVHRLDRATSGILVCAFSPDTARTLGEAFLSGQVKKTYWAVVRGWPADAGTIDVPLSREEGEDQPAQTEYRVLTQVELPIANNAYPTSRYALVEAKPKTGRYHQIRRHFAQAGHPILGDTSHGDLRHNRRMAEYTGFTGLHLHAAKIEFPHPADNKPITKSAPPPSSRINAWEAMGIKLPRFGA